mmetsp:Transcript_86281/g.241317  ORF Transcript_86281/g.241317 Transcript_86281/m.241317 type:complete len:105 (+) Transcript_86281:811-1125(+)
MGGADAGRGSVCIIHPPGGEVCVGASLERRNTSSPVRGRRSPVRKAYGGGAVEGGGGNGLWLALPIGGRTGRAASAGKGSMAGKRSRLEVREKEARGSSSPSES